MTTLQVGDEVRVFDVNGSRRGQPEGGYVGHIVKVGRTLAHIEYKGWTETFRLDNGRRNDNYGHQWFKTLEQAALDERRSVAEAVLRNVGVELSHRRSFTLEQIEALAEVAKTFGKADR